MKAKIIEMVIRFFTKNKEITISKCQYCQGSGVEIEPMFKNITINSLRPPEINNIEPKIEEKVEPKKEYAPRTRKNYKLSHTEGYKKLTTKEKKKIYMKFYNQRPDVREATKLRNRIKYLKLHPKKDTRSLSPFSPTNPTDKTFTQKTTTKYWMKPSIRAKRKIYYKQWRENLKKKEELSNSTIIPITSWSPLDKKEIKKQKNREYMRTYSKRASVKRKRREYTKKRWSEIKEKKELLNKNLGEGLLPSIQEINN